MDIDQRNGYLYFVFYDRRAYAGTETDVYMARSTDGGATFENFKISQAPFVPSANVFFGDYTNLSVQSGVVRPIWTRMDSGALSVWTALIDTAQLSGVVTSVPNVTPLEDGLQSYPNPFTNSSFVSFKLRQAATVTITIYDITGRLLATPLKNKRYAPGKYVEKMDAATYHVPPGMYLYTITIDGELYTRKMIKVE